MTGVVVELINPDDKHKLDEVFKLRYYVHKTHHPDHFNSDDYPALELKDDIDQESYICGAYMDGKLIGTLRFVVYKKLHKSEIELDRHYHIFELPNINMQNAGEAGRFCVLPEYEKYGVSVVLMKEATKLSINIAPDLRFVFTETTGVLVKYYEFFNFKLVNKSRFDNHINVEFYLLCLDMNDFKRLMNI